MPEGAAIGNNRPPFRFRAAMSNPAPLLALAAVLSGAVAFGVTTLTKAPPPPPATDHSAALQGILQKLEALQQEDKALRQEMVKLHGAPTVGTVRHEAPTLSDEQIAAAVARYFQERGGSGVANAAAGGAGSGSGPAPFDRKAVWTDLRGTNAWENGAAWKKVHDAGQMDELLKEFEAYAEANPNEPKAHMELANAYLAALQFDQTKWPLSQKADAEFDKVLTLDSNHWEARFSKAVSYTFWPDFLGKKKEALQHFETLVEQQKTLPVQPHHAQTYLFLGNLLEQRGNKERAREIWQQGAQRHPDSQELKGKLGN